MAPSPSDRSDQQLESLLDYLKHNRGFDFTGYKRPSLARRIDKRMLTVGVASYVDYIDYLEVHPEEFAQLFNTVLINLTSFFRDPETWEYLATDVLPALIERKGRSSPIRLWSAGCASGEEAYTLAILMTELLGPHAYKERVKIYATDIDEDALGRARQAVYSPRDVSEIPEALLARYFDSSDAGYTFKKELRRHVIFGRHDLMQDAPISRADVLVCRNVLMYFNAETQARILARFHFALNDSGILFLGRAETLLTRAATFAPIDLKRRISMKVPRANLNLHDRLLLLSRSGDEANGGSTTQDLRLRDLALDAAPMAQIVVDPRGEIVLASERSRALFGLTGSDIGRPIQDLKLSYRPLELRSLLEQVAAERRPILVRDIEWITASGEPRWFDAQIMPLMEAAPLDGAIIGSSIAFLDVSVAKRLQHDLEQANQALETAYEEVQSTNEELETTNEELQSTVEELETTNEELQSTNEELETMNEELQSTNEELTSLNDELRQRGEEINRVNGFLESILASFEGGVIVLDDALQIVSWNNRAQDLWGLREQEVIGKHLLGLDIGLPLEKLKQPIKAVIADGDGSKHVDLAATNRRGKSINCRIAITPLLSSNREPRGAILVMQEV